MRLEEPTQCTSHLQQTTPIRTPLKQQTLVAFCVGRELLLSVSHSTFIPELIHVPAADLSLLSFFTHPLTGTPLQNGFEKMASHEGVTEERVKARAWDFL